MTVGQATVNGTKRGQLLARAESIAKKEAALRVKMAADRVQLGELGIEFSEVRAELMSDPEGWAQLRVMLEKLAAQ